MKKEENKKKLKIINELAQQSKNRLLEWQNKISQSDEFAKLFHEGAMPLKHPDLISFRPRSSSNRAFSNLRYTPEKQRAIDKSRTYNELYFLDKNKYNSKDSQPIYRQSNKLKNIHDKFRHTFINTHQKIAHSIRNSGAYSNEPLNEKLKFNPQFRVTWREKWISRNDFKMGYKNKSIQPLK